MDLIYRKFFKDSSTQFSSAETSAKPPLAETDLWNEAKSDSLTLSLINRLVNAHNSEMASDHSSPRKLVTSVIHATAMVWTSTCIGIPETATRLGLTVVTSKIFNDSEHPELSMIPISQANKTSTTLVSIAAGCLSAIECLTKERNLDLVETLKLTSLGRLDLSEEIDENPTA